MTYLIDAHHLGARQTGNETWVRNVLDELAEAVTPDEVAVCVSDPETRLSPAFETHRISTSSMRRLAVDLPRVARACDASAILVQYTMPMTRRPCVVMIHDLASFDEDGARWLGHLHARRIRASINHAARHASVLLAPSSYTRSRLAERYGFDPETILVAPNAVDPRLARALDATARSSKTIPARVLAVGNVVPRKNLAMLAQAVAMVRAQGVQAELRIVGQVGARGEKICTDVQAALGDAVSFSGYVTNEALACEYRAAHVLAFPSLHEGFGIPALEAMYAGLPVIASSTTALPEVVDDAGLVVPPEDPLAWSAQLGRVLTDETLAAKLAALGRQRALSITWKQSAQVALSALRIAAETAPGDRHRR